MKKELRSGHWLNKGMDIEVEKIDDERSAALSVVGFELVPNGGGGRDVEVRFALRFISGEYELGSRALDSVEVGKWLSAGSPLVREAFEWLKKQDGVSNQFAGFAAEYERAFEFGQRIAATRALGPRL